MNPQAFYDRFRLDLGLVQQASFNPYYPVIRSGLDEELEIDGARYIDLASNNYLGLANDARVRVACHAALDRYGASMCATPVASGYTELYSRLEQKLSYFTGMEASLIYPSCYQANNGLFHAIAGREDIALIDRMAHSSLIEGVRASGCKIWPFLHNDLEHLEKVMKKVMKYRQVFVVTESVFSTEGALAPFRGIVGLCEKYGAVPVIDDSHGIGVLGAHGKGILEHENIEDYQGIYTASLGKALANAGGVLCGKKTLIDYLRYYSTQLVYSTAILPVALAGIERVLEIMEEEFERLSRTMWSNTRRISAALESQGFSLCDSRTPIVSVRAGDSLSTLLLAKKFYENGILTTPFIYPSVQRNEGRIRLIAGANLTDRTIDRVVKAVKKLKIGAS
jgi:glycine C-acetyltransferase